MALPSKVKPGDPIKATDWNALLDCVRSAQITPGSGIRVTRTPSGTTLAVDNVPSRRISLPRHPFQVVQISSGDPDTGENPTIGIISDSHVIDAADKDAYEEDNSEWGLLNDDETDGDFDLPNIGDKIWLQFTFDADQNLTSIDVMVGPVGDDNWDEYPDPISINTDDDPYQEYYHQIIAEATDPDNDPRDGLILTANDGTQVKIVQILKTNLTLVPAATTDDADEPCLDIMVAIPSNAPATADDGSADEINEEEDIKTPWSFAAPGEDDYPFKLDGYVDEDGQGWITVAYGEINEVAPDGMSEGDDPYEMKADDDGVVFVTVTLDSDTREVVSFCFDMAADEESIDDDAEMTMHVVIGRFYIDTDADENGLPVPVNTVTGNINMSVEPVINADGRVCLDMVHTYLRDAVPTGFFNMEVFDTEEDGTPVDGCSSMFLSVGDTDDPSNDGLTFQANDNYLEIVWGANQDAEYPIPAIKFTDSDGNVSKIDSGGLSFWDDDGSEDNPEVDLSMDGLCQWDMDGDGSLLDTGGLSFWDGDSDQDNPQVDLSLDGLKIWDMDGNDSNLDAGGITFDDADGDTSNLDATNVTFTDSDGDSSTLDGGGLTFTSGEETSNMDASGLTIGDTTALTDGDLDLGDDGTIEIGESGSITVGSSVLSDGDLDLGGDGTIEAGGSTFSPQTFTFLGDDWQWHTIEMLATDQDDTSDATEDIWDMISDNVDDSIRTALDSLSASIDCDAMTVTFSYSY